MILSIPGTGSVTLPSGSALAASPATGDRSTAIATMQKFLDEFGVSKTSNGYQKLPSGLIIQWGNASWSTSGTAVSFPMAFPTGCLAVVVGMAGSVGGQPYVNNPTATGFNAFMTAGTTSNHYWLAIGY